MKSATQQAIDLIQRWTIVAAQDNTPAGGHGVKVTPKGRFINSDNQRIGYEAAVQSIAYEINKSALPPEDKPVTGMHWDRLNTATHDFFYEICKGIMEASGDVSLSSDVNQKSLNIGLSNAPRLSNLKKAGLIMMTIGATKSIKMLRLTDEGKAKFMNHA